MYYAIYTPANNLNSNPIYQYSGHGYTYPEGVEGSLCSVVEFADEAHFDKYIEMLDMEYRQ